MWMVSMGLAADFERFDADDTDGVVDERKTVVAVIRPRLAFDRRKTPHLYRTPRPTGRIRRRTRDTHRCGRESDRRILPRRPTALQRLPANLDAATDPHDRHEGLLTDNRDACRLRHRSSSKPIVR